MRDPNYQPVPPKPKYSWSDQIEARWDVVKGEIKKQWGKLTDDDLVESEGEREKLIGKLMSRYKLTREEAEGQLDSWAATIH